MEIQIRVNSHGDFWGINHSDEIPIAERAAEILAERLEAYAREQWPQAGVSASTFCEPTLFGGDVVVRAWRDDVEEDIMDRVDGWWDEAAEQAVNEFNEKERVN